MKTYKSRITKLGFVTLIVVSVLAAILLASALNNFSRVSDSALADNSLLPSNGGRGGDGGSNAPRTTALKNYLPIIFLNSATAGGAWLLAGNAGTMYGTDFLGTTDNVTFTIRVSNTVAFRLVPTSHTANVITGFSGNMVAPGLYGATIGGGGGDVDPFINPCSNCSNVVSATFASIGGGYGNSITVNGGAATIGGGYNNTASGGVAVIDGGQQNTAGGLFTTIGGGYLNTASNQYATVGGGYQNSASNQYAAVAGGGQNTASNQYATIGGGHVNSAGAPEATVGGGGANIASGQDATVPGGVFNDAVGAYSFAAGHQAKANHQGAFVWADSTNADFNSTAVDQFLIRANGGVGINTNTPPTNTLAVNGNVRVYDNDIYLRGSTDTNHGIGWYGVTKPFSSTTVDGPVMYGYDGGALGTNRFGAQKIALQWDASNNVTVNGKLTASGGFNGECATADPGAGALFCNMDVAEGFASTELTTPGDLVALVNDTLLLQGGGSVSPRSGAERGRGDGGANGAPTVRKSTDAYDALLIGVVSQNPGLVFDNGATRLSGDNSQLITNDKTVVALVGRVQVKVSIENGIINVGDPLTSSSTPGVAMKATQAGKIIGYAMESTSNDGKILALVQPGDYVPPAQLDALSQNAQLKARVNTLENQIVMLGTSQSPLSNASLAWGVALLAVGLLIGRRVRH